MSENQSWGEIAQQVRDAIGDTLATGDFSYFGDVVSSAEKKVADTIEQATGIPMNRNPGYGNQSGYENNYNQAEYSDNYANNYSNGYDSYGENASYAGYQGYGQPEEVLVRKVGNLPSMVALCLGCVGAVFFLLITVVIDAVHMFLWQYIPILTTSFLLVLTVVCIAAAAWGFGTRRRLGRAQRYAGFCGTQNFCNITDICNATGKRNSWVVGDIQKMISAGIFPQGHLDYQQTCLMLSDAVYSQYQESERQRGEREAEQSRRQAEADSNKPNLSPEDQAKLDKMISDGNDYIRKIREQNDIIPGEEISKRLYTLENLLKEIFARVQEQPKQMGRMQKFMDYYLPTTLKLVESYARFDQISDPGADVEGAKTEIEKTIDTINSAFKELLSQLYQDTVYDVTTDAQVLKTMLANEGLTGDFASQKASK
ncbi:MAG: 5-bromo-4-chloroindolyl phosphate hydrolysis family protein [Clostridiales bacterium]|nr:5-bromo-4-chloroindolyl phosphate hydrolysis family protein [Clostridiales bacterium]